MSRKPLMPSILLTTHHLPNPASKLEHGYGAISESKTNEMASDRVTTLEMSLQMEYGCRTKAAGAGWQLAPILLSLAGGCKVGRKKSGSELYCSGYSQGLLQSVAPSFSNSNFDTFLKYHRTVRKLGTAFQSI